MVFEKKVSDKLESHFEENRRLMKLKIKDSIFF